MLRNCGMMTRPNIKMPRQFAIEQDLLGFGQGNERFSLPYFSILTVAPYAQKKERWVNIM